MELYSITPYENSITQYITVCTGITQYITVCTEIYFLSKVYVCICTHFLFAKSICPNILVYIQLNIWPYMSVWNFQIKYMCMLVHTFTADFFVLIERVHNSIYWCVWVHTMCNCFVSTCTLPASLHSPGPPAPCWRAWIWKQRIRCRNKTHFVRNK